MATLLITGINGFVGHHLAKAASDIGHDVRGVGREPELSETLQAIVQSYDVCDLSDADAVNKLGLQGIDAIINLAGFAKVGVGEEERAAYLKINRDVHTNYADLIKSSGKDIRMVSVSSGAVYDPDQLMPLTESSKILDPDSAVYTSSKIAMEVALRPYQEAGLDIVVSRPFNHSGPGQLPGFLIPDLAEQIEVFLRDGTPLHVGNLHTKRDYSDVRDVVQAYIGLALCDKSKLTQPVYNICSGRSIAGTEILRLMLEAYGVHDAATETDATKIRAQDASEIYGSYEALAAATGWQPVIPIEQTIQDFVSWRKSVS